MIKLIIVLALVSSFGVSAGADTNKKERDTYVSIGKSNFTYSFDRTEQWGGNTAYDYDSDGFGLNVVSFAKQSKLGFALSIDYGTNDGWADSTAESFDEIYWDIMAGIAWRPLEWVTLYPMVGIARYEHEAEYADYGSNRPAYITVKIEDTGLAYGIGAQLLPFPQNNNVYFDVNYKVMSFNDSALDDTEITSWFVGVGYKF